jgi:gamma-glutamyltranspeptidase/glutathione hydrolase
VRALLALPGLALALASPRAAPDLGVPSTTGLVVSVSDYASDIGAAALARGGHAVDAGVATSFALAVTHPAAGNIGGGGFMLVRTPGGEALAFDYRERAPFAATRDMYLGPDGRIVRERTNEGYLAPGVPGSVRGLELAHRRLGRLAWKDLVMPAVLLADRGFVVSESLARGLNAELDDVMGRYPASVAAYGKPGGGAWAAGDRLVLKDLAKTLGAIADGGADAFYTGWIAELIDRDMRANGGLITKADLAAYEAKVREPVRGRYRDYDVLSVPPPSAGGITAIEMLNMLEPFELAKRPRFAPETLHLLAEAARRAYLDRARHLGDPDFTGVPVATLTSKAHARGAAASIDPARASSSLELGRDIVTAPAREGGETTHFSVLDRDGMAVACTTTLEFLYGSRVVVSGAGFLLNNEMGDFNRKAGETNTTGDVGTPANLISPGKRMVSSMTPTIVSRNGRLVLVTGTRGGRTIANTVTQIVLSVIEFGMTGREAVDAPRLHHQWMPDRVAVEDGGVPLETVERLQQMGHEVRAERRWGDAHTIWVDPATGTPYGVNDRRSVDSKASTP